MTADPKVSVLMPCYNHEKYVGKAIESVLNQTYSNYELIVADNGSLDNSFAEISKYQDKITIVRLEQNDIIHVWSKMLEISSGEYVAIMTSDDYWLPEKLERQMEVLEKEENVGVCTTWAYTADENLNRYETQNGLFWQKNKSRAEWLKRFVREGNCIAFPSAVMHKVDFEKAWRNSQIGFRQVGDMFMWITVLMEKRLVIVEEPLMLFRWHNTGSNMNMSAPSAENNIRIYNETAYVLEYVFENTPDELFVEAFAEDFKDKKAVSGEDLLCEKILLMSQFAKENAIYEEIFLHYFYRKSSLELIERLQNKYGYTYDDLWEESGRSGIIKWASCYEEERKRNNDSYRRGVTEALMTIYGDDVERISKAKYLLCHSVERTQVEALYQAIGEIVEVWNEFRENAYDNIKTTLIPLYELMSNNIELLEYLNIVTEDDAQLFGQLVTFASKEKVNLDEAIVPFMTLVWSCIDKIKC